MWTFVFSVCDISIQFLVAVVFVFVVFLFVVFDDGASKQSQRQL